GPDGQVQAAGDRGGAERAGHGESHAADAGGAARGGIAGSWSGADRRSKPGEPRNDRTFRARSRDRRDSKAAEPAPDRAHAGLHESLRPRGVRAIGAHGFWFRPALMPLPYKMKRMDERNRLWPRV